MEVVVVVMYRSWWCWGNKFWSVSRTFSFSSSFGETVFPHFYLYGESGRATSISAFKVHGVEEQEEVRQTAGEEAGWVRVIKICLYDYGRNASDAQVLEGCRPFLLLPFYLSASNGPRHLHHVMLHHATCLSLLLPTGKWHGCFPSPVVGPRLKCHTESFISSSPHLPISTLSYIPFRLTASSTK